VEGDLHALLGQARELVEEADAVQERGRPRIAAAGRIGDLGDPHWPARLETIAQAAVVGVAPVRAGEPFLR
jgi:hypothetical protein